MLLAGEVLGRGGCLGLPPLPWWGTDGASSVPCSGAKQSARLLCKVSHAGRVAHECIKGELQDA